MLWAAYREMSRAVWVAVCTMAEKLYFQSLELLGLIDRLCPSRLM